jgi:hypothetical protein
MLGMSSENLPLGLSLFQFGSMHGSRSGHPNVLLI